ARHRPDAPPAARSRRAAPRRPAPPVPRRRRDADRAGLPRARRGDRHARPGARGSGERGAALRPAPHRPHPDPRSAATPRSRAAGPHPAASGHRRGRGGRARAAPPAGGAAGDRAPDGANRSPALRPLAAWAFARPCRRDGPRRRRWRRDRLPASRPRVEPAGDRGHAQRVRRRGHDLDARPGPPLLVHPLAPERRPARSGAGARRPRPRHRGRPAGAGRRRLRPPARLHRSVHARDRERWGL
ncbi:MAG: Transcriptional regulator, GntR family, partial [uncultured Acetobacteraceae bacterium]